MVFTIVGPLFHFKVRTALSCENILRITWADMSARRPSGMLPPKCYFKLFSLVKSPFVSISERGGIWVIVLWGFCCLGTYSNSLPLKERTVLAPAGLSGPQRRAAVPSSPFTQS